VPFTIHADKPLRACGRAKSVAAMLDWLSEDGGVPGLPLSLPVVVELSPKPELSRGHLGRFLVQGWGRRWLDEFRIVVSIGCRPDGSWYQQLATVPHELRHVGQWVSLFGPRTPWAVVEPDYAAGAAGFPSYAPWKRIDHEGGPQSPEDVGRDLVDMFLADHPEEEYPVCPQGCPCGAKVAGGAKR
jgi:hypothetical protein